MSDNILVTGRWGETHVTSAQAGNFNAGIVGDGCYVMSGLDATMKNANTCHISPGFGSFNGRDFEVPAGGIDLTIDNGTQAQHRNDLVVVRYALEPSSQTESAELVVVKGAPAASEPADPAINEGSILDGDSPVDMPLYRVPLDGISVGDPEPLFEVMPSLAELRDSVSRTFDAEKHEIGRTAEGTVYEQGIVLQSSNSSGQLTANVSSITGKAKRYWFGAMLHEYMETTTLTKGATPIPYFSSSSDYCYLWIYEGLLNVKWASTTTAHVFSIDIRWVE